MVDDFMRCLAALPCSPQSLAVQTQVAMYAFARGYERTHDCPSALEFRPRVIDTVLAKKYMIEEIWRITEMTGLALRRSQAVTRGALSASHVGFATPARERSPFLCDLPGVSPTSRTPDLSPSA